MPAFQLITNTKEQVSSRPNWPSTMVVWTLRMICFYNDEHEINGMQKNESFFFYKSDRLFVTTNHVVSDIML